MRLFKNPVATGFVAAMVGSVFAVGCGGQQQETEPSAGAVGQVGRAVSRSYAQQVTALSGVEKVMGSGGEHVLARTSDGKRWGWGANFQGQVGTGSTFPFTYAVPTQLTSSLSGIVDADTGTALFSVAVDGSGSVYTFGNNSEGQLGNGTTSSSAVPLNVLSNGVAVSAGSSHAVALKSDGTLWAWGRNASGQLGDGTTTNRSSPVQVTGLGSVTVTAISAGGERTYALDSTGHVWVWGYQVASNGDPATAPQQVSGVSSVTAIAAAETSAAFLKSDGTVSVLGLMGSLSSVTGLSSITSISAGNGHYLAVDSSGSLWTWGSNSSGQLGNGTTTASSTPVQVLVSASTPLANVASVGAARESSYAVLTDGTLWSWGADGVGQLGTNNL